ncbi:MAG: hypothetical protein ACOH2T_19055 [Pseudomonas sp.]
MSRPAKLNVIQASQLQDLHLIQEIPVAKLAKRFKVSESTAYKVVNGTYQALQARKQKQKPELSLVPFRPTPSLFHEDKNQVLQAATLETHQEVDALTLAAAELIVARANFNKARLN